MSGRNGGRTSIFQKKTRPVSASITPDLGWGAMTVARTKLAKIIGWPVTRVSDADVIEAVLRGWPSTRAHVRTQRILKKQQRQALLQSRPPSGVKGTGNHNDNNRG